MPAILGGILGRTAEKPHPRILPGMGQRYPSPCARRTGCFPFTQPCNTQFVPVTHQAAWSKASPSCCTIPSAKDAPGSPGSCHSHLSMLTWHHQPSKVPTPQNTCWLCMAWGEKGEGWGQCIIPVLDPAAKVSFCLPSCIYCQREEGWGPCSARGAVGAALTGVMALALLANCLFSHLLALGSSRHSRSPPARRPQRHPKPASQLASAAPPPRLVLAIPPGFHMWFPPHFMGFMPQTLPSIPAWDRAS